MSSKVSRDYVPLSEHPSPTIEQKYDKGQITFSNGQNYRITKIKIGNKQVNLNKIKSDQLETIQNFFNHISKDLPSNLDKKNLRVKITQEKTAVTGKQSSFSKTTKYTIQNTSESKSFLNQMQKAFSSVSPKKLSHLIDNNSDAENSETEPLLGKSHLEELGKEISDDYVFNGKNIATQTITRMDTVAENVNFLKNMLDHWMNRKKQKDLSPNDQKKIDEKIEFYQTALENAIRQQDKSAWLSSTYFRDHLQSSESYQEAADSYVSAPVNMRYQEIRTDSQKAGFYRIGVMSDMRNGWFSLEDLEKMKDNPALIEKHIQDIKKSRRFKISNDKQRQSAQHAIQQLELMRQDSHYIQKFIDERNLVIEQQMIQLISGQVNQNVEKINQALTSESPSFKMVHVALLNQQKKELDKTGWVHNERVEMEDMAAIFKRFEGYQLVFNDKGPRIDNDEKKIYLLAPIALTEKNLKPLDLSVGFFNISVQGNTKNDAVQQTINKNGLKNLSIKDQKVASQLLNANRTSYQLAEDFIMALLKEENCAVSIGCLSAKDRTGFVAERLMIRHLPQEARSHFYKKIFDHTKPPSLVVADNTPNFQTLKVDPRSQWPGYKTSNKVGPVVNQIFENISKYFKEKFKIGSQPAPAA